MANRWGKSGNSVCLYFWGPKITADGDCSHEIKRHLLLGRKVMSNLDSRDITLSTKVHLVKAMFFPVVMCGCESWTIKKAEGWRIDAFELWCWRRLLRVPWTARRSNQSILKVISPRCSLEGLMLKLKFQYFGPLMQRADSFERPWCWEKLRAGAEGDERGWQGYMASPTQWTWFWVDSGSWLWTGRPGTLWFMGSQTVRHDWVTELNWSERKWKQLQWTGKYFPFLWTSLETNIRTSVNICWHEIGNVSYNWAILSGLCSKVFPGCASGKEHTSQCRRQNRFCFDFSIGKIPWIKKWHSLQYSC